MFGIFNNINPNDNPWAHEATSSRAHGRTWTILDIPILGWLVQLIMGLFEPKKLEMNELQKTPKVYTEDEKFAKEQTQQFVVWNEILKTMTNFNPSFLDKISYTIEETEKRIPQLLEIRKHKIINDLKKELRVTKKLIEKRVLKQNRNPQILNELKIERNIESGLSAARKNIGLWDPSFYLPKSDPQMVF